MSTTSREVFPKFLTDRLAREWVGGFLLAGVLVGLLGSLLIVWQYHIDMNPEMVGLHFLVLNTGYLAGAALAQRLSSRISLRSISLIACSIAFAGLVALSFLVPPIPVWWRLLTLSFVGASSGALVTALLHVLEPYYAEAPAAAINLAGLLFGLGSLVVTLIVATTYFAGTVRIQTALLALFPLAFFIVYSRNRYPPALSPARESADARQHRASLKDLRNIAALLFSLLLFFQFGNEWAIAGWLPLFLIHRLGSNPKSAIFTLALYFFALMLGRLIAQALIPRSSHRKLLLGSIVLAMFGYLLLSFTDSLFGAAAATVVIGAGFAPIYPLIAETLDDRFAYHPGFYNGIFSIAITGAMCAPWLLGYVDSHLGIQYVMLLPAFGSMVVFVLALLIMLEARLMSGTSQRNA